MSVFPLSIKHLTNETAPIDTCTNMVFVMQSYSIMVTIYKYLMSDGCVNFYEAFAQIYGQKINF